MRGSNIASIASTERLAAGVNRSSSPIGILTSLLPTGVFLMVDAWLGLIAAIISATVTTGVLIVLRQRHGNGVGVLLPASIVYTAVKAAAGIVTQSPIVYSGSD